MPDRACSVSRTYQGLLPPRCARGTPCGKCWEIYLRRQLAKNRAQYGESGACAEIGRQLGGKYQRVAD